MCIDKIRKFFRSEEDQAYYNSYNEKCIELAKEKGEKDAKGKYEPYLDVDKDKEVK